MAHKIVIVLACMATALAMTVPLLVLRRRHRKGHEDLEATRTALARAEAQSKEQARIMARMRTERGGVANLALVLPHLVQELNSAGLQPRRVPSLILRLAEAIFQPGQILYYAARSTDRESGAPELHLVAHIGLPHVPEELRRVPFGEGRIGWVAENRIDMLREDWLNPVRTDGRRIDDNHPVLRSDIVGPLVHGSQLLGVLCVGALGIRLRDEKLLFQLVTNLGSLALVNSEQRARLNERANTDGLTGLLNRDCMERELAEMIYAAEREAQPLGLFLFDIDHFKNYNDTNGHPAGDDLLRALAGLLRRSLRPGDACSRFGGEEFIVAMPDTTRDEAWSVAERIRNAIATTEFPHEERQPNHDLTISGGVAAFPQDGTSVKELTSHADKALYEAKRQGRNRVLRYRGVNIGDADDATDFEFVPSADEEAQG